MNIGKRSLANQREFSIFDLMIILRIILLPFSLIYGLVMMIRNGLFDKNIKKVTKVNSTVISVGNLSVGGTGKTPHVEFLLSALAKKYNTAVLSRGYGRKTKGFVKVNANADVTNVGDEALNYAQKFEGEIEVAVCEKRVEGARKLLENYPETEVIVLDDAYQHRYLHRDCNILLTEFNKPYFKDFVLPAGRLREFKCGRHRADMVIVTKSPSLLKDIEKQRFKEKLKLKPKVPVFFSSIQYGDLISLATNEICTAPDEILLVTGIGNPQPLISHLEQHSKVSHLKFGDHHDYTIKDIEKIHKLFGNFVSAENIIVTTEKDAVRLKSSAMKTKIESFPWYYQAMTVKIDNENKLLNKIDSYVKSN
ncbi:tetraacyldisaccharide 4'-kinase [Brumimicrobium salinarum]|uniref:Tetraacyldisaccharide 4'-kinase n=1 Tax=Brumimicrobium salinarum TaxID=2058658 RepID=A0A2I0QZR0_9FLAO|nr:tetraacyldisaccharide 4'-kinase [Brumimicrobium salinarum]PKR79785.1 tetraacyldisaccharide 4'-kinase [Brumimicrobium salinarum]